MSMTTRMAILGAAMLLAGCQTSGMSQTVVPTPVPGGTPATSSLSDAQGFQQWVAAFRAEAAGRGISQATLATAFDTVQFLPKVIDSDQSQSEFTKSVWTYLDSAVSPDRIRNGQAMLAQWSSAANSAEQRYGVPKQVIVAIWGIESNYGQNFGNIEIIDALATLGYEGRRQDFAKTELYAALQILQQGDISRDRMLGSWAGAMGNTQFLPSVFLSSAVDADGDGRRDIWGSIPDVMASTANYLAQSGWQRGQPWGVEVTLPPGFDYSVAELTTKLPVAQWAAMGVKPVSGRTLPALGDASVITPAGARGPAFLVGPNFGVIMKYNASTSYALAVGHLSDRLAGGGPIAGAWPRDEQPLSRNEVIELQTLLEAKGFSTGGTPDGLLGPATRKAIRGWQVSKGQIPDGFATTALLQAVRAG
ncbi:lytic murein transglycosylase [Inquilinus ginsengisoli]|uniref:Lytic murein transglycosylase n=1 Tax=Inquilinus ginsengisoli TaxID=363840 RepID=A0ABU1K089_9PROT|nr:lytic murein transglycosylase [Inquilinus ginsengisoli]MDR6293714.1 lytic murein transglycosylase [Inquilinus ginsengisoli]